MNRNLGLSYISTSDKVVPDRHHLGQRCQGCECDRRKLSCSNIPDTKREELLQAFWDTGNLHEQRQWISRHVTRKEAINDNQRKHKTLSYSLPGEGNVCKQMFLGTLSISERFIRTTLEKLKENGVLENEKRGGRRKVDEDNIKRASIKTHIDKFPRMESHYCRANSKKEYLSSDLTFSKMFELYKESEEGKRTPVSYELYRKVFMEENLKFHHPKKDQCGICDNYRTTPDPKPLEIETTYKQHIEEKEAARMVLANFRKDAENDPKLCTAIFDLQKVMYLPKSNRGEVFYKRRLACLNFTIYDTNGQGHCYFWHEAIAARGANEIASCLKMYIEDLDKIGIERLALFSDGCAGQNKNSILPAMIRRVLQESVSMQTITLHFFETNHGQSEGDSIHSAIETAVDRLESITMPGELVGIIKSAAKKRPYNVIELMPQDVLDWKADAAAAGILRVRKSDSGMTVCWPNFMQIQIQKDNLDQIAFKTSHRQTSFDGLTLPPRRTQEIYPKPLEGQPKLSKGKYQDLVSLCTGHTPVIRNPMHAQFYLSLPSHK